MDQKFISGKTKKALIWMSLANEPFVILYSILPFILRKDLHASLLQLSIFASLRPLLSIFSFYWSANLTHEKYRLRSNLISAWLLARVPFLAIFWIQNTWFILFCSACYELLNRSGNPALMEILKTNLQKDPRERIYNFCFVLSFLESILLGLIITSILTDNLFHWHSLFGIAACLSLTSLFAQSQIPLKTNFLPPNRVRKKVFEKILTPWKDAFTLLKQQPNFLRFQLGFMLGGIGLMLAAPGLACFLVDSLFLSHGKITMGRSILMGIGVILSSYFWRRMITSQKTDQVLTNVLIGFFLYLLALYFSKLYLPFFYVAFLLYGTAQAGSHLLWNLSGPIFSGAEDSSQFSRVNILMVGLRGSIAPACGGILCKALGPEFVILISSLICLAGASFIALTRQKADLEVSISK